MSVFVNTSAILAVLNSADEQHEPAAEAYRRLLTNDEPLVSTNYVVLETVSLLQRRLGLQAVQTFQQAILPTLSIEWLTPDTHEKAMTTLLSSARRRLSLVDCSSFVVMQKRGLKRVFTFDAHFSEQGFEPIPG